MYIVVDAAFIRRLAEEMRISINTVVLKQCSRIFVVSRRGSCKKKEE